jgi:hypothetical protein
MNAECLELSVQPSERHILRYFFRTLCKVPGPMASFANGFYPGFECRRTKHTPVSARTASCTTYQAQAQPMARFRGDGCMLRFPLCKLCVWLLKINNRGYGRCHRWVALNEDRTPTSVLGMECQCLIGTEEEGSLD